MKYLNNTTSTITKNPALAPGEIWEIKHWFMPEAKKHIEMHYVYKGDVIKKIGQTIEQLNQ